MKAHSFVWHYAPHENALFPEGARIEFLSYRAAARHLGKSETTIRYYQEKGIHCSKDLKKKRKKQ